MELSVEQLAERRVSVSLYSEKLSSLQSHPDEPRWRLRTTLILLSAGSAFVGAVVALFDPALRLDLLDAMVVAAIALILMWIVAYIRSRGRSATERRVLLVGGGPGADALTELAASARGSTVALVGRAEESVADELGRANVTGYAGISRFVRENHVSEIVLTTPGALPRECVAAIAECYESGVRVSTLPEVYEELSERVPVELYDYSWLGTFPMAPAGGLVFAASKRVVDVTVSAGLLVLLSPLIFAVGAVIRFSSGHPIFFRQLRIGLNGEPFYLMKFRTMETNAGGWGARVGDVVDREKITPVGKWLRRLYLDEIPQLFLVLSGHMSLVGPRPMRAEPAIEMEQIVPLWRVKYRVRPGVTGLGQIRFGYAWDAADEIERLKYDLYYIRHRSMRLDLSIAAKTVIRVLTLAGN